MEYRIIRIKRLSYCNATGANAMNLITASLSIYLMLKKVSNALTAKRLPPHINGNVCVESTGSYVTNIGGVLSLSPELRRKNLRIKNRIIKKKRRIKKIKSKKRTMLQKMKHKLNIDFSNKKLTKFYIFYKIHMIFIYLGGIVCF